MLAELMIPVMNAALVVGVAAGMPAMVLGVSWAANQYWQVPALLVPDMVPTHGALNAFGFVLCGHLACWLDGRRRQSQDTQR